MMEIKEGYKPVLVYKFFHYENHNLYEAGTFHVKSHEYAEELLGTHLAGRQWAEDYIYYFTIKPINWDDYDTYVPDGF